MSEYQNDFEAVRRLLSLKRHEVPPPGYFHRFSDQVIQRIRVGEAAAPAGWSEELYAQAPWLVRFLQSFGGKPVFAGSFAGALCMLLVFGIVYAERPDVELQPLVQATPTTASLAAVSPTSLAQQPVAQAGGIMVSTNPVFSLQPVGSAFGQQNPLVQPVSLSLGN